MLFTVLLLLSCMPALDAATYWKGILMDGQHGLTQLLEPGMNSVTNRDYKLPHLDGQAAAEYFSRVYFIGGGNAKQKYVSNTVTIFHPLTNTTTIGSPMQQARMYHSATVFGGVIVVCGGFDGSSMLYSCEYFSAGSGTWAGWRLLENEQGGQSTQYFAMATLGGQPYAFGGDVGSSGDQCGNTANVMRCCDGDGYWQSDPKPLPNTLQQHAAVALDADRALVCGGIATKNGTCIPLADCNIYTRSTNSWSGAPPMAQMRCQHSMLLFNSECFP
jgi:hypothetical protein